jgi:hypothetical protein
MALAIPGLPAAPKCGHDIERVGSMTYENTARPWWRRLLGMAPSPASFTYCMTCHMAFRRLFDGYWEGRLSLAEVRRGLEDLHIPGATNREYRGVLRELRRSHAA